LTLEDQPHCQRAGLLVENNWQELDKNTMKRRRPVFSDQLNEMPGGKTTQKQKDRNPVPIIKTSLSLPKLFIFYEEIELKFCIDKVFST
jgi:hypothetical protein